MVARNATCHGWRTARLIRSKCGPMVSKRVRGTAEVTRSKLLRDWSKIGHMMNRMLDFNIDIFSLFRWGGLGGYLDDNLVIDLKWDRTWSTVVQ